MRSFVQNHGFTTVQAALDRSFATFGLPLLDTIEETEISLTFGDDGGQHLRVSIDRYGKVLPHSALQDFHMRARQAVKQLIENGRWLHPHAGLRYESQIEIKAESRASLAHLEMVVPSDTTEDRLQRFYNQVLRYVNKTMSGSRLLPFGLYVMEEDASFSPQQLVIEGTIAGIDSSQVLQCVKRLIDIARTS